MYLYISEAKVKQLADASPAFLSGMVAKLGFNIAGVLKGSLEGKSSDSLVKDLEGVIKKLQMQDAIVAFDEVLSTAAPRFVSFEGVAGRLVEHGAYWMALRGQRNALLLLGSAGYALGRPIQATTTISPSVDPVGAIREAFEDESTPLIAGGDLAHVGGLSFRLSYAWQEVFRTTAPEEGVLPAVEGVAIFARSVPASMGQMQREVGEPLSTLIVGTPIYIRQK
jgi:hypothetical protein